jgi:hypothetical protein
MAEKLIIFPFTVLIIMAFLGLLMGGIGNGLNVDHSQDQGVVHYSNPLNEGVTHYLEPLVGITNDSSTSASGTINANVQSGGISSFVLFAAGLAIIVGAVIVLATVSGTNILSSGLNNSSVSILYQTAGLTLLWAALTACASGFFFNDAPLGIGIMFYAGISIMFFIGVIMHVRGGATSA